MSNHLPEKGVYFEPEAYAGVWRRIAIAIFDVVVALIIATMAVGVAFALLPQLTVNFGVVELLVLVTGFCYFVLLTRTRWGTLGYALGGVRIVDFQGKPPSINALTIRFLFIAFGLGNLLLDVLWISNDPHRQALRDKLARTYVVRKAATPAGYGDIRLKTYFVLMMAFVLPEVRSLDSARGR